MENILDDYSNRPLSKELYESIKWWEKRRVVFNVLVGLAGVVPFIIFLTDLSKIIQFTVFFQFVLFGFFANMCYSFGWAIDILKSYYLESPIYGTSRVALFFLGIIFSISITLYLSLVFLPK